MNKLGDYINELMMVIKNTEEKPFVRKLAIEELKKLDHDLTSFILEYMDDIEEDILSQPSALVKNNHVPSKDINFENLPVDWPLPTHTSSLEVLPVSTSASILSITRL